MISVLTLTYQRHHILEEAIQSFLLQDYTGDSEMVVINDSPDVTYEFNHPNVKVINSPTRFSSIGKKIEFGYKLCKYDYIYRLDDDDLLAPHALSVIARNIEAHPGHEIYRSAEHYFFLENKYRKMSGSINNGNVYSKSYLDRIVFPELSGDEDVFITFNNKADIFTVDKPTMIYRWGMSTYHISGMGIQPSATILQLTDRLSTESGKIELHPRFKHNYFIQLPK